MYSAYSIRSDSLSVSQQFQLDRKFLFFLKNKISIKNIEMNQIQISRIFLNMVIPILYETALNHLQPPKAVTKPTQMNHY